MIKIESLKFNEFYESNIYQQCKLRKTEIKLIEDTPILNQKSHYLPKTLHRPRELRKVIFQNYLPFDVTASQNTVHSHKTR